MKYSPTSGVNTDIYSNYKKRHTGFSVLCRYNFSERSKKQAGLTVEPIYFAVAAQASAPTNGETAPTKTSIILIRGWSGTPRQRIARSGRRQESASNHGKNFATA